MMEGMDESGMLTVLPSLSPTQTDSSAALRSSPPELWSDFSKYSMV